MKTKKVAFGVAEKLEIVQTRQQGLSLSDVGTMYGVHPTMVSKWTCAYERNGIAGLETGPKGRARQFSPKVMAAEQIIKEVVQARIIRAITSRLNYRPKVTPLIPSTNFLCLPDRLRLR